MAKAPVSAPTTLEEYAAWVQEVGLDAPWSRPGPLIASKTSRVQPFIWRWADIAPRLERSPDHMAPGDGGERRILRLVNPGVPELTSAHTLSVAVQYLLPGETAPIHAHSPNALRFMLHGEGAYTVVEGQKCVMSRGDVVLTPHRTVHGHGNEGDGPVVWVDVLDSPVVRYLEILSMEHPDAMPLPERRLNIHYHWRDMEAELQQRASGNGDPHDDVIVEYRDPDTGRSVLPSISCYAQMLRPGVTTKSHKHTATAVYHVVSGSGSTVIDDVTYEWSPGDFFLVPPLAAHHHLNASASEPAVLFSAQDKALLTALGLYWEV
jgi:gentisate 1,2-dioxygenase